MQKFILPLFFCSFFVGCSSYKEVITFPASSDIFITSGDGDIQKPYTPIGEFVFSDIGIRIPIPIIGLIPFKSLDPEKVLRNDVTKKIKEAGGDALINMKITYVRDNPGFLGLLSKGGYLYITGTIIKR